MYMHILVTFLQIVLTFHVASLVSLQPCYICRFVNPSQDYHPESRILCASNVISNVNADSVGAACDQRQRTNRAQSEYYAVIILSVSLSISIYLNIYQRIDAGVSLLSYSARSLTSYMYSSRHTLRHGTALPRAQSNKSGKSPEDKAGRPGYLSSVSMFVNNFQMYLNNLIFAP